MLTRSDDTSLVFFHGPVYLLSASQFQQQMLLATARHVKRISILLASEGGSLDWGKTCMDTILMARAAGVEVVGVTHFAYSMAALMLQTCSKRIISPSGTLMIHGISTFFEGDAIDQQTMAKFTATATEEMTALLTSRTKKRKAFWDKILKTNKETFFTAQEAMTVGLVDEIASINTVRA